LRAARRFFGCTVIFSLSRTGNRAYSTNSQLTVRSVQAGYKQHG
jgi:hypothetical protein